MPMHAKSSISVVRPSWRTLQALTVFSVLLCIIVVYITTWGSRGAIWAYLPNSISNPAGWEGALTSGLSGDKGGSEETVQGHPIQYLIKTTQKRFDAMLTGEATSLEDAAAKYRERRGRHPPPGFDAWYAYATESGALLVESFFDQIYDDLAPFWGIQAHTLRQTAHAFSPAIAIRKGVVDAEAKNSYKGLKQVMQMLQSLAKHPHVKLPDMDVPVNVNEEPTMLVSWDTVDTSLSLARPLLPSTDEVANEFAFIDEEEFGNSTFDPEWLDGRLRHTSETWFGARPLWSLVQLACAPGSPARSEPLLASIWHKEGHTNEEHSAAAMLPLDPPTGTLKGYVKNWTTSTDACQFPYLQGLHGAFVAPENMGVTQKLFPLFSSSKIAMSNEILIPSITDWSSSDYSLLTSVPWAERDNMLSWRGPATGGKNTASNWQRFQRHRFVSMLNATHVEIAEGLLHEGNETTIGLGYGQNFRLLPANEYDLETQRGGNMAEWVSSWADAALTDLHCDDLGGGNGCPYDDEYFSAHTEGDNVKSKYGAVIDGNGGDEHGAFLHSLQSGKLTLRASIYRQWYDNRVIPWLHYVPMDNMFVDLYGIMEYFRGTQLEGVTEFAHAHVEVGKHEHHFQTPHSSEEEGQHPKHEGEAPEDSHHGQGPDSAVRRAARVGNGHDRQAQKIAEEGQRWAEKVLRKEDMLVYVYRLLLEYARVVDDRRARLGWVDDLVGEDGR